MKVCIHPDYKQYEKEITALPRGEYARDEVYCHRRNTVERVTWGGRQFVVKRFKRPTLANCVVYTLFRKTKARRAYEYAGELLRRGIETARPVAYIEQRRYGFFHTGWFVSEYLSYPLMQDLEQMPLTPEEKRQVGKDFLDFTARLHGMGILPGDYNLGNIFFHREAGEAHYRFALIDINRLKIGHVPDARSSVRFFEQLGVNVSKSVEAIGYYAGLRGFDTDRCLFYILLHRLRTAWTKQMKRKVLKRHAPRLFL